MAYTTVLSPCHFCPAIGGTVCATMSESSKPSDRASPHKRLLPMARYALAAWGLVAQARPAPGPCGIWPQNFTVARPTRKVHLSPPGPLVPFNPQVPLPLAPLPLVPDTSRK